MTHKKLFIPGPVEVHPDVLKACAVPMIGHRDQEYSQLHGRCVAKLREMLAVKASEVFLFTSSATGAMEAAVRNLSSKRVLACTCGAFSERWLEIARENGKAADACGVEWGRPNLPDEIDRRLEGGGYDLVTVVWNETSTGLMNPVPEIARVVARHPGVLLAVDAVSNMAGMRMEPEALGIDLLLAGVQKAFGLPPGLTIVAAGSRAMARAAEVKDRGHYFDLLQYRKYAEKDQTPETPAISLVHALDIQLGRMKAEGFQARWDRTRAMAERCRAWALERGFGLFPEKGYESVTLTCVANTRGIDVGRLNDELGRRGYVIGDGYGKLKGKTFRIAHMADLQPADLDALLGEIDSILG